MEPAGAPYPRHWEADVLLRDGATMRIRPIRPSDAEALQAFHVGQSEESTYYRFFAPLRRLPERDLTRLVTVDHHDRVALVLVSGVAIVAVGRFDRVDEERAEVAFNVSDHHQGRGLGSVLLEHLAAAARELGISTFIADVLPGNAKMLRVFSDAGYDVVQRYEDGVISLELDLRTTARSLEVIASREQRTDAASMRALLAPTGVAVVAGSQAGVLAERVAEHLQAEAAVVTCVGESLRACAQRLGHGWCADVSELSAPVQLALVAGAAQEVIDLLAPLAAAGVRGVVVLTDGFDGEAPTQGDLLQAARAAGVRLVGPRSFGLFTRTAAGPLNATLWPTAPAPGPVALFCQSGALALELSALVAEHGLGVATLVCAGHRADVSGNDLLQYAAGAEDVRAVGLYLESLGNPRKFGRVVSRVGARMPVVAVVGASERETRPDALGRTAIEEAMLSSGVLAVPTMRAMVTTTALLAYQALPPGHRVVIVANSASVAGLAAAQVAHLDPNATRRVLPWSVPPERYAHELADLAQEDTWDAALVLYSPPLLGREPSVLAAIAALGGGERPVLAVVQGLIGITPELTSSPQRCVPAFECVEDAVGALTQAWRYAQWREADLGELVAPDSVDVRAARELTARELSGVAEGSRRELSRGEARKYLRPFGIDVLRARTVSSPTQALAAARMMGWPVAVKSTDRTLRHRADLGGVRLDVAGPIDLVEAVRLVRQRQGGTGRVIIQPMAPLGVACVIRGWVDPVLGPVISFGLAGDATDLLGDERYVMLPVRTGDVHRLIHTIRAAPRLHGTPTRPGVNTAALEDLVARVAVAMEVIPQLQLLELRPALASSERVVVLEATIELVAQARPDAARRALRG